MAKTIKAQVIVEQPTVEFPVIEHEGRDHGFKLFGPKTYEANVEEMQRTKYRSAKFPEIALAPATISQSISLAVDNPTKTKSKTLDLLVLLLGPYVRASEGVFLNPPRDLNGEIVKDERTLYSFLTGTERVNGIYVVRNSGVLKDFAFVPADTYLLKFQEHEKFLEGGLARGFEHANGPVKRLPLIANSNFYPSGVYVSEAFKSTGQFGKTEIKVAGLASGWGNVGYRLSVGGDNFYGFDGFDGYGGCAFGVFDASETKKDN